MKIGHIEVTSIHTGVFRLDGGAMFGVVPRVLWEKTDPPDEKNRILMALRCLVIRTDNRTILVDSGIGEKWDEKSQKIYGIDHSKNNMNKALTGIGLQPSDITDVLLTHLHFDHVGGSTYLGEKGEAKPSFPKATYYVQSANLEHAHAPSEKDRASFIESTIMPLKNSGRLKRMEGPYEIIPGVQILVSEGHSPGHQLVKISGETGTLVFCGDTIPTSSHIPIPYVMSYDLYPLITMNEKKRLLEQAVAENWILTWPHDPKWAGGIAQLIEGKYSLKKGLESI